jgi:hypothetical protein
MPTERGKEGARDVRERATIEAGNNVGVAGEEKRRPKQ